MTTILAFVVVVGLLILIHELGHFVVARLSGVGVERFSIGFGPVLWRVRGPETEYCLSAVPMGGYVKMMGDDENPLEGGAQAGIDPAKSFNRKPLWVRFLIVFAGPGMNFVLAAVIFALMFMVLGRPMVPAVVGRVADGGPAAGAGLAAGDRIVAVSGQRVEYWEDVAAAVQTGDGQPLVLRVRRGPDERTVTVTPTRLPVRNIFGEEQEVWDIGARFFLPPTVGEVVAGYPAAEAGLRTGDTILAIEGQPVASWDELAETIHERPGVPTRLAVERGGDRLEVSLVPRAVRDRRLDGSEGEVGRIGIGPAPTTVYVRSNPVVAAWDGALRTAEITGITVVGLYKIIVGQLERSTIGGPIQIAVTAGEQARQGLPNLAFFMAVISVNLAVLNLLPVPMLDGGHLLFFAVEAVLGRPLSVRKREVAQQVGLVLLLMLMGFAVYNDLARIDLFRWLR